MSKLIRTTIAIIVLTALFVRGFGIVLAASMDQQRCSRGGNCRIGEFLYDDSYDPITQSNICTLSSKDPSGSAYSDPPSNMSTAGDGWYYSSWTVDSGETEGIYPTQVCCTPAGESKVCVDKTFVIGPSILSASEIASAVWDAQTVDHGVVGSFSTFLGDLTASIWAYTTRSLTSAALTSGQLAVQSQVDTSISNAQTAINNQASTNTSTITGAISTAQSAINSNSNSNTSTITGAISTAQSAITSDAATNVSTLSSAITAAQNSIKGASNRDLTQVSTALTTLQSTADSISTDIGTLQTSVTSISGNVDTLITKWGTYSAAQIVSDLADIQTSLGTNGDLCAVDSVFGQIKCVKDKWGSQDASAIYTAANTAATTAASIRSELNYNGKSTTAYEDLQDLLTQLAGVDSSLSSAQSTITAAITASETAINTLQNSNADTLSSEISAAQTAITSNAGTNTSTITGAITSAQNAVTSNATTNTNTITSAITTAQNNITGYIDTNNSVLIAAVSDAQDAINAQAALNLTDITDAITASQTAVTSAISAQETAILSAITSAQTAINTQAGTNTTTITGAISATQTAVINNSNTNTTTITGAITTAQTNINSHSDTNTTTITDALTLTQSAINSNVDDLETVLSGVIADAQTAITTNDDTNTSTITGAIGTAQTAINSNNNTNTSTITAAITAAQNSIKGASNRDLTQVTTDIASLQTTANSIVTKVDNLQTSVDTMAGDVTTIATGWATFDPDQINTRLISIQDRLGTNADDCLDTTVFGYVQCIKDKWGSETASTIYTAANNAYTTAAALRSELAYNGKSTTAYEDIQTLLSQISAVDGSVATAQSTITDAIASAQTAINTQAGTNTSTITGAISSAQSAITSNDNTNTSTVTSAISSAQSAITSNDNTNTSTITGAISTSQTAITSNAATNTSTITGAITSAQNNINTNSNTNTSTITGAISSAQSAITSNAATNVTTITAAITATENALSSQASTNVSALNSAISDLQDTADAIAASITSLETAVTDSTADVNTLITKWGSYDAGQIITAVSGVQSTLGTSADTCVTSSIFGHIKCVQDKWGAQDANALYTAANSAATTAAAIRNELAYNGKSTTAYEDMQSLLTQLQTVGTSVTSAQSTITSAISAAQASIKGSSDRDLTQLSTQVTGVQTTANSISTTVSSISTKVDLMQASVDTMSGQIDDLITEWNNSSVADVLTEVQNLEARIGQNTDTCAANNTVFGYTKCLQDKWGAQDAASIYTAANTASTLAAALRSELNYNGKSTTAYEDLQSLKTAVTTVNSLLGNSSDNSATATIFGRIKLAQDTIETLDTSSIDLSGLIAKWGDYSAEDLYTKINEISDQVEEVNQIDNVDDILEISEENSKDLKELKNQVLGLTAVVDVNKVMLDKISNGPIIKTWLEEGSIIFKTLITNPSSTNPQTVPIKVYLPREATEKDIMKVDAGLKIEYSSQDGALYAIGEFNLQPGETKILEVELTDIWKISDEEIASLRNQTEELAAPLKNTSFFAQSVTIRSDIMTKLDTVQRTQNEAVTPDQRISTYRNNKALIETIKRENEDLKGLLSQASQSGNLLGSIGGAQAISVWVIVIILLVSFVFMIIYLRVAITKLKQNKHEVTALHSEPIQVKKPFNWKIPAIIGAVILVLVLISAAVYFLVFKNQPTPKPANTPVVTQEKTPESTQSAPAPTPTPTPVPTLTVLKVTIEIPSYSDGVNIRSNPSLTGEVIIRINKDTQVEKFSESGDWVEVSVPDSTERGWVSKEFVK